MKQYTNYGFKQLIWFLVGFTILWLIKIIKVKSFFKYSAYLYYINIFLLILVLFIGKTVNGSQAWFDLGFVSFQPSELMKLTLALYLSNTISKIPKNNLKDELRVILKALFLTIIPSIFVFLEPDTGAIIIYFLIMLGTLFVYKINYKWYIIFFILIISFLSLLIYLYFFHEKFLINLIGTSFFYRIERILAFLNNNSFQLNRSLIAIGNSKFFNSFNYVYIPEAPTDFIIAFSINNYGILSFVIIIFCFFILDIFFLLKIFKTVNFKFKLFISAFLSMFIYAQIQNIGMNLGLLPIIGLPLPFLSYGGTNIIVYFLFLGIILNSIQK